MDENGGCRRRKLPKPAAQFPGTSLAAIDRPMVFLPLGHMNTNDSDIEIEERPRRLELRDPERSHLWIGLALGLGVAALVGTVGVVVYLLLRRRKEDEAGGAVAGPPSIVVPPPSAPQVIYLSTPERSPQFQAPT